MERQAGYLYPGFRRHGSGSETQGRIWQEEEYCVDNNSGLIMVHSIAPGTFAVFGYNANQQFHGRTMPDRISIDVGGTLAAKVPSPLPTPLPRMRRRLCRTRR